MKVAVDGEREVRCQEVIFTRYFTISGIAFSVSMLPTKTKLKVEGSLKQSVKYRQPNLGSTLSSASSVQACI